MPLTIQCDQLAQESIGRKAFQLNLKYKRSKFQIHITNSTPALLGYIRGLAIVANRNGKVMS